MDAINHNIIPPSPHGWPSTLAKSVLISNIDSTPEVQDALANAAASFRHDLPKELLVPILMETDGRSLQALGCCCGALQDLGQQLNHLVLKYFSAREHENSYRYIYEKDPANAPYFGKEMKCDEINRTLLPVDGYAIVIFENDNWHSGRLTRWESKEEQKYLDSRKEKFILVPPYKDVDNIFYYIGSLTIVGRKKAWARGKAEHFFSIHGWKYKSDGKHYFMNPFQGQTIFSYWEATKKFKNDWIKGFLFDICYIESYPGLTA
jgi:hypothetical protein